MTIVRLPDDMARARAVTDGLRKRASAGPAVALQKPAKRPPAAPTTTRTPARAGALHMRRSSGQANWIQSPTRAADRDAQRPPTRVNFRARVTPPAVSR